MVEQRQAINDTPQYQAKLAADSINGFVSGMLTEAADPERFFVDDLCWSHAQARGRTR